MKNYKRFNLGLVLTVFILIFIIVFAALAVYNQSVTKTVRNEVCVRMDEVLTEMQYILLSAFNEKLAIINIISSLTSDLMTDTDDWSVILQRIQELIPEGSFDDFALIDTDGNFLESFNGIQVNISGRNYFKQSLAGNTAVSPLLNSNEGKCAFMVFSAPVEFNQHVEAVVAGRVSDCKFNSLIASSFNGRSSINITDKNGDTVFSSIDPAHPVYKFAGINIFEHFQSSAVKFEKGWCRETVLSNLKNDVAGHAIYEIDGVLRQLHYKPFGLNGWTIQLVVLDSILSESTISLRISAFYLTLFIIAMFAVFTAYSFLSQARFSNSLYRVAYFDELTGIYNLAGFKKNTDSILQGYSQYYFSIIKFDVQNFKIINEMFGFKIGDMVLVSIAQLLRKISTQISGDSTCCFARIKDDEFIVLTTNISSDDSARVWLQFLKEFKEVTGDFLKKHSVIFNFGRYYFDKDEKNISEILEKVNLAHRTAKKQKSVHVCEYNSQFKEQILYDTKLENMMESALISHEFQMYLQPKYRLCDEKLVGAEALVRWYCADEKLIMPNEFIPLFERNGFITKLDFYMLETVCAEIKKWIEKGLPVVPVSVNFSRVHLENSAFIEEIDSLVCKYGVPKKYIEIELTETAIFKNEDLMISVLDQLHEKGFLVSMDDFGSGYSSLGLLKNLPVDIVKIDRTFFDTNNYPDKARIIIASVFDMTKKLQISTVAEGVETQKHIDLLKELGCDIVQGYYFSKPCSAKEFVEKLKTSP